MTSELPPAPEEAFVWIWLPGSVEPVVAGRLARADRERGVYAFNYGRSYLERKDALPIFLPELPLVRGALLPEAPLTIAGCLRDGAPDAWGRRVIIHRLTGLRGRAVRDVEFDACSTPARTGPGRLISRDLRRPTSLAGRTTRPWKSSPTRRAASNAGSRSPRASSERSFMAPRSAALVPRR